MKPNPPSAKKMVIALQTVAGMRQEDIAAATGGTQNFVSNLKVGRRTEPRFDLGFKLYVLYLKRVKGMELSLVPVKK